jgi:hypothetical protein
MTNNTEDERIILFKRLTEKKDQILKATQAIEIQRNNYVKQNKQDSDGEIESEIYKNLYTIIASLSELMAYSGAGNDVLKTLTEYTMSNRIKDRSIFIDDFNNSSDRGHIAGSKVLDSLCVACNVIAIHWRLKREPIVKIERLESIIKLSNI